MLNLGTVMIYFNHICDVRMSKTAICTSIATTRAEYMSYSLKPTTCSPSMLQQHQLSQVLQLSPFQHVKAHCDPQNIARIMIVPSHFCALICDSAFNSANLRACPKPKSFLPRALLIALTHFWMTRLISVVLKSTHWST